MSVRILINKVIKVSSFKRSETFKRKRKDGSDCTVSNDQFS